MLYLQPSAPMNEAFNPVARLIVLTQPKPPVQISRCSQGLPEGVIAITLNKVMLMIPWCGHHRNRFNS